VREIKERILGVSRWDRQGGEKKTVGPYVVLKIIMHSVTVNDRIAGTSANNCRWVGGSRRIGEGEELLQGKMGSI